MISSVSNSTPAADQTQPAAAQNPAVIETPFGDVLASQITGINLDAWVADSNSGVASTASTAPTTGAASTPSPAGKEEAALRSSGTVKPTRTAASPTAASPDTATSSASGSSSTAPSGNAVPTVQSVFGSNPWMSGPTGTGNGGAWDYNPIYFATEQTAQTAAQILGGTVVAADAITSAPGSPLQQNQPNYMVQLSNGAQVNAGLVADLYNHGYSQSYIDQELTAIKQQGVSAS
jgi:hypothetical protein